MTPSAWPIDHLLARGVTGQQVERQAALALPERVDRQPDVDELVHQPAQRRRGRHQLLPGQGVVGVGFAADQRIRQAPAPLRRRRSSSGASQLQPSVDALGAPDPALHRRSGSVAIESPPSTCVGRCRPSVRSGSSGIGARLERGEAVAHGTGECAHGPYGGTVQLLLVRHALPLRSEPGQGSDPELSSEGIEQAARLPDALARYPITRLVSSPQRRAVQTAQPVADALGLQVDIDERVAEYDRDLAALHADRADATERPQELERLIDGQLPGERRRGRVPGAGRRRRRRRGRRGRPRRHRRGVQSRRRHQRAAARDPGHRAAAVVPRSTTWGDPAAVVAQRARLAVASVNSTEHVWDLLPRNHQRVVRHPRRWYLQPEVVDKSGDFRGPGPGRAGPASARRSASPATVSCAPS